MPSFFKKKKSHLILGGLVLFHLILISLQVPLGDEPNYFEKAIFSVFSPIQHGIVFITQKISGFWKGYFDLRDAHKQNERMRAEMFLLRQENHLLRIKMEELSHNENIQETLEKINESILPVRTIGIDTNNYFSSVIVNRGALDKIKKNMVVLDEIGNLVGRIIEPVSLKESRVQLITDTASGISVFSGGSKTPGILSGNGKGLCNLEHILSTAEQISQGDRVFTSGFAGIYPPGINVGTILEITETSGLFKKITVQPNFKFKNLDRLAVIMIEPKEFF